MIKCTCGAVEKIKMELLLGNEARVDRFGTFKMKEWRKAMMQGTKKKKILTKTVTFSKTRNAF